jgi:Zn-dependent peptidase ImmA (M78 family)
MTTDLGHRFACAAALGRLLWQSRNSNSQMICGAQGDHAMLSHTRRSNAFAAEFLLPREVVENVDYRDSKSISRLSQEFSISQSAAEWHTYNVANDPDDYWA